MEQRLIPSPSVTWFLRPYTYSYDLYSDYYRTGLRRYLDKAGGTFTEPSMTRLPGVLRFARRLRDAYRLQALYNRFPSLTSTIDRVAERVEGEVRSPNGHSPGDVHFSLISTAAGQTVRVVVDPTDDGQRINQPALEWCQLYYKTNRWRGIAYDPKVVPLVNADPLMIPRLPRLRALRTAPRPYDVCMVVRVWGGEDEVEGVEHNLRLLEAVARVRGSKFLYAYLVAGDIDGAARRLERQGIPCGTDPFPGDRMWDVTAASRLNVIRLGMHHCIPWRMTGLMAIGSTVVLDRVPLSQWPEPLVEGTHFLSLGAETGVGQPLARDQDYASIPERIESWLADEAHLARMRRANADYFDRFMDPEQVGEYLVERSLRELEERRAVGG